MASLDPYPPTNLSAGSFGAGIAVVRCVRRPAVSIAEAADAAWIPTRRPSDVDWRWRVLLGEARDAFALLRVDDDEPVAMFCSHAPRLLRIDGGPAYRLDAIEVGPHFRGAGAGALALAVVASRALECRPRKLVLAATVEARRLYDAAGGRQHAVQGWNAPPGLLPYEFTEEALDALRETLNEQRQD